MVRDQLAKAGIPERVKVRFPAGTATVTINLEHLAALVFDAKRNATRRSVAGPIAVRWTERKAGL